MNYLMYNEFYQLFKKRLRYHFTGELRWAEVLFRTERVVNGTEDILRLRDAATKHGIEISVLQIYEDYMDNVQSDRPESLDSFLDITANWLEMNYSQRPREGEPLKIHDVEVIDRENVIFMLISTELNRELLENLPHRSISDLSVIYLNYDKGMEPIPWKGFINNEMMEAAGMSEQDLYDAAFENTRRLLELKVVDFGKYLTDNKMQKPRMFSIFGKVLVVTGKRRRIADAAILYPDIMEEVSEMLDSGEILLMPLSINEWFAVPPGKQSIISITNEIRRTNSNIKYSKVLSDKPYVYNVRTGSLRPAEEERDGVDEEPEEQTTPFMPVVNALHGYRN